ncbi:hypothetical protein D9M69_401440 [compost metagenome]
MQDRHQLARCVEHRRRRVHHHAAGFDGPLGRGRIGGGAQRHLGAPGKVAGDASQLRGGPGVGGGIGAAGRGAFHHAPGGVVRIRCASRRSGKQPPLGIEQLQEIESVRTPRVGQDAGHGAAAAKPVHQRMRPGLLEDPVLHAADHVLEVLVGDQQVAVDLVGQQGLERAVAPQRHQQQQRHQRHQQGRDHDRHQLGAQRGAIAAQQL